MANVGSSVLSAGRDKAWNAVTRTGKARAVWILVGALWVSIGMIVSATIVTVAYLA